MSPPPLVVGLRPLKVGDFCAAVPAWKAMRAAWPDHRSVLAAPEWQRPLLALCPAIDELVPVEAHRRLPPALGGAIAVNLHGRGPGSSMVLAASQPRQLIAFRHRDVFATAAGPAWDDAEHEVTRWCRLLESAGVPSDPEALSLARPATPSPCVGATVLHPGASAPARRWPIARWAAVAQALAADGHRMVVTGSAAETARNQEVIARAGLPAAVDLSGRTDLPTLAAVVADARLVVSGDTGPAHLATGYATPSVVLFGPTPPTGWGPPAHGPHAALWAGRTGDPHGRRPDAGLLAITVRDVLAAVPRVLGAGIHP